MASKVFVCALVASLLLGATWAADANYSVHCKRFTLDFIIKQDDPEVAAVEDDIVKDLARIGITVNTRKLNSSAYI